jgi:hypothetical protein
MCRLVSACVALGCCQRCCQSRCAFDARQARWTPTYSRRTFVALCSVTFHSGRWLCCQICGSKHTIIAATSKIEEADFRFERTQLPPPTDGCGNRPPPRFKRYKEACLFAQFLQHCSRRLPDLFPACLPILHACHDAMQVSINGLQTCCCLFVSVRVGRIVACLPAWEWRLMPEMLCTCEPLLISALPLALKRH